MHFTDKKKVFITFIIIFITFCLSVESVFSDKKNDMKGRGYIIFEVNNADMHDLNSRLTSNNYSKLSNNILSVGVGGHSVHKNKIIREGYLQCFLPLKKSSKIGGVEYNTSMSGMLGTRNWGYLVYSQGGTDIFPMLGFGFGGLIVRIREEDERNFDDVLKNPRESRLKASMYGIINISLGIDKLFLRKETDTSHKGLGFGARLGYRIALIKADWMNVAEGPDFYFTGPYVSMTFGGGYNKKE